METIRVNMTPCEDIKTIHASQNDNEAREWGFELHNNGEKIDSSSISDQMVFKAYEGGTEQILPVNGSTPTTSPFLGDIKYPQGLLTDQEFTYRQSPTESDGLAFVESIKGNTLAWNQLINNGNFASTTGWKTINTSLSVANNKATITINGNGAVIYNEDIYFQKNHKILVMLKTDNTSACSIRMYSSAWAEVWYRSMNRVDDMQYTFIKPTDNTKIMYLYLNRQTGDVVTIENIQAFDLTQMGLDITDPSDFTSLFSLPYYAYNQGTLLSFMGNGIKTVGKNLVFKTIPNSSINGSGVIISTSNFQMSVAQVLKGKEYVITTNDNSKKVLGFYYEEPLVGSASYNGERIDDASSYTFTSPITGYVAFRSLGGYSTPMLEFGTTATSYEPYTSSTLSLPISTYFPNGMDGVPYSSSNPTIVYDELTDTKAIKRTNKVIYDGSNDENWQLQSINSYNIANFTVIIDDYVPSTMNSSKCNIFTSQVSAIAQTQTEGYFLTFDKRLYIRISSSKASTVEQFRTWLASNNIEFVYRLATPTETSFTTASLVTENAEIPLSNEDGILVGKCTEQLSSESGFFDAKIKLADDDGECYSNKLQLHVERSPQ